ncbi:unnamed protein product [Alternaria sp. RS040]
MAPATFSDLPPEMVSNVFAFVRLKADQGAICLVSRVWRDSMAPMMWEELETDLSTASAHSMETLLHPRSRILIHVRDLAIHGTKEGEDRLKLVVAAIPRDRVRSIWAEFYMGTLTLHLILFFHRKIEDLAGFEWFATRGHSELSDLDSEEHHEWMGSSLLEVLSIRLALDTYMASEERVSNRLEAISRYCPKITTLSLFIYPGSASRGAGTSWSSLFNHPKEAPLFPNLTVLRLRESSIALPEGQKIFKNLNLSKVRTLELRECYPLIPFLEGLSSFYTNNTGDLNELVIEVPTQLDQAPETLQAMEKLLRACPQLKNLHLDFSRHGLIAKDCILVHRRTLISLSISTGQSGPHDHFSAENMTSILGACDKLNNLAMNMPSLGAVASLDAEFVNMLNVISKSSSILTFRVFNLPKLGWWDQIPEEWMISTPHMTLYQALMQNIANQILRFMAEQGSNLKVLGFQPSHEQSIYDGEELFRDGNGHRWPEYHYCRAHATDITGTTVVIANPLRKIGLEFPAMAEFFDYI